MPATTLAGVASARRSYVNPRAWHIIRAPIGYVRSGLRISQGNSFHVTARLPYASSDSITRSKKNSQVNKKEEKKPEKQEHEPDRPFDKEPSMPLVSPTAEDLLKQRFLHAQKRSPGNTLMTGGSGSPKDMPSFLRGRSVRELVDATKTNADKDLGLPSSSTVTQSSASSTPASSSASQVPDDTSLMGMASSSSSKLGSGRKSELTKTRTPMDSLESSFSENTVGPLPTFQTPALAPIQRGDMSLLPDQPFDSHVFVRQLEAGGWKAHGGAFPVTTSDMPASDVTSSNESVPHRHDPAEAIMDLTRSLLKEHGKKLIHQHINRSDLDNQLYLFSSALAELRTEVRVRARNDAAALRSITLLLEREIDGLTQKLQSDIEQLKHDIQVEQNTRKTEVQEESNNLEQEIQDLNNRFTIFLSDLRTEIEQSIKWDTTRRALALVFGIVAIMVCTLAMADYFTRTPAQQGPEADAAHGTSRHGTSPSPPIQHAPRVPVPIDHTLADDHDAHRIPPQSAEELGLLPRYDADEVRYV